MTLATLLLCVALPAAAQEAPEAVDCSAWSLEGITLGTTVQEASAGGRSFQEFKKYRDPLGYRRYVWQAPDRARKIELHVDTAVTPQRVIGVMTTVPTSEMPGKAFLAEVTERWGEPQRRVGKGAFTLYTFASDACDVAARVSVMNAPHEVGAWVALNSASARDELARRKAAREVGKEAEGEASAAEEGGGGE
jgi:hypothetical protein